MAIIEGAAATFDLFKDIGSLGGPDEWLWALVVLVDVISDSHDQLLGIVKDAATQPVLCDIAEEAFDHVQPPTAGRREVDVEPGMTREPSLHSRMLVRGVVIDDEVECLFRRRNLIDHTQELKPLLMPMPVVAHADHSPIERIHGGKQSGCSVPFVVVGHGPATALFDR